MSCGVPYETDAGQILAVETDGAGAVSARAALQRATGDRPGLFLGTLDAAAPGDPGCVSRHGATLRVFADGTARLALDAGEGCAAAARGGLAEYRVAR